MPRTAAHKPPLISPQDIRIPSVPRGEPVEFTQGGETAPLDPNLARDLLTGGSGHLATQPEVNMAQASAERQSARLRDAQEFEHPTGLAPVDIPLSMMLPRYEGLARGLTAGVSDAAIVETARKIAGEPGADAARRHLNLDKEFDPAGALTSEMGGMLLPFGAAAKGAGAAARGLGAGALGVRTAIAGADIAANAAYEGLSETSRATLANEPITTEKFVAGMKHGALFGTALVGGGAVLGRLGRVGRVVEAEAEPAARAAVEAGATRDVAGSAPKAAPEKLAEGLFERAFAHDMGATPLNIKEGRANFGGTLGEWEDMNRAVETVTGKPLTGHAGVLDKSSEALAKVGPRVREYGAEHLRQLAEAVDAVHADSGIRPQEVWAKVRGEQALHGTMNPEGELVARPGDEATFKQYQTVADAIQRAYKGRIPDEIMVGMGLDPAGWKHSIPLVDMHQMQSRYYKQARGSSELNRGALERVGQIIDDELVRAGERLSPDFQRRYHEANRFWYLGKQMEEFGEQRAASAAGLPGARTLGGAAARYATHAVAGGAIGGVPGAVAGVGGGMLFDALTRGRGGFFATDLASKVAAAMGVHRTVSSVTREIGEQSMRIAGTQRKAQSLLDLPPDIKPTHGPVGTAPEVNGPVGTAVPRRQKISEKRFNAEAKAVLDAQANPQATSERVSRNVAELSRANPDLGRGAILLAMRGIDYLATKLPPDHKDPYSVSPLTQRRAASAMERAAFLQASEAVHDPLIVLREVHKGSITSEHVRAVKAVYPSLYDEIRSTVLVQLMQATSPVPYQRRIAVGVLFEAPTDQTMSDDFLVALKKTYLPPPEPEGAGLQKTINKPLKMADSLSTMFSGTGEPRRR